MVLVVRERGRVERTQLGDAWLTVLGATRAKVPVAPGNSDLCFEWDGPIWDAVDI